VNAQGTAERFLIEIKTKRSWQVIDFAGLLG
jgi:hypothetical protein